MVHARTCRIVEANDFSFIDGMIRKFELCIDEIRIAAFLGFGTNDTSITSNAKPYRLEPTIRFLPARHSSEIFILLALTNHSGNQVVFFQLPD